MAECRSIDFTRSDILDDIRCDQELNFESDQDEFIEAYDRMTISLGEGADLAHHFFRGTSMEFQRRHSSSSPNVSRRSSQIGKRFLISKLSMESLQREVDVALELFSQENSDEDDFLENNYSNDHAFLQVRKCKTLSSSEFSDGSTLTASTHPANSFCDFSDSLNDFNKIRNVSGDEQDHSCALSSKHRTISMSTLPQSILPSKILIHFSEEENCTEFHKVVGDEINLMGFHAGKHNDKNFCVDFSFLRMSMEPFLTKARLLREEAKRNALNTINDMIHPLCPINPLSSTTSDHLHIGSSYGVPYSSLRNEMPFLYDVDTYPLHEILANTLKVSDLSQIHIDHPLHKDKMHILMPLENRALRRAFHQCYDSFVTSHVIPLLHSQALSREVLYTNRHNLRKDKPLRIVYRYQAFPTINIIRPGECSKVPHCDMALGHSIGNLNFHVPLTASFGTNALFVESRPGREDWHPLSAKSGPGLGFQFDGARCLHFNLRNETNVTQVSINFSVAITRDYDSSSVGYDPDDQLCCPELLKDKFSMEEKRYYDEVVVSVGGQRRRSSLLGSVASKKHCV